MTKYYRVSENGTVYEVRSESDRESLLKLDALYVLVRASEVMPATLEDKFGAMLWYLEEVRRGRRDEDPIAFESYLDDPEIARWLDKLNKKGRIKNTRFIGK